MSAKTIDHVASSALVWASMIDIGLLAYYLTLSSKDIDAMWNLPFIGTWLAALLALISLNAYMYKIKPKSKPLVLISTAALVVAVSLELLVRNHLFIR